MGSDGKGGKERERELQQMQMQSLAHPAGPFFCHQTALMSAMNPSGAAENIERNRKGGGGGGEGTRAEALTENGSSAPFPFGPCMRLYVEDGKGCFSLTGSHPCVCPFLMPCTAQLCPLFSSYLSVCGSR
jgi:hypothetical protein